MLRAPRAAGRIARGVTDPDLSAAADAATLDSIVATEPPLAAGGRSWCPALRRRLDRAARRLPGLRGAGGEQRDGRARRLLILQTSGTR